MSYEKRQYPPYPAQQGWHWEFTSGGWELVANHPQFITKHPFWASCIWVAMVAFPLICGLIEVAHQILAR